MQPVEEADGLVLYVEPYAWPQSPSLWDLWPARRALRYARVRAFEFVLAYAELRYRGTEQAMEAAELLLPKVLDDAAH